MRSLLAADAWAERARPPVRWFLVFAGVLLGALAVQRGLLGGLTPAGVVEAYLGPDGAEPVAAVALWEEVHVHAFLYGFLLLMAGSLLAASPVSPRVRAALLAWGAVAGLADLFAPFAVVASGAGWIRVATFAATVPALAASIALAWARFGAAPGRPRA